MSSEFTGLVAVVTGAGSGIGKATAIHFAKFRATVVVSDRQEEAAKDVVASIVAGGGNAISIPADVTSFKAVENLVAQTVKEFGRLDVIVNNAGIGPNLLRTHQSTLKDWDKVIAVNQTGVFYCMKVALVQFLKQGGGNIVNIASLAGLKASPNNISYSASKFAMQGFLESLRCENLETGLHVLIACPGYTESNIRKTALDASGSQQNESPLKENKLMSAEAVAEATWNAILGLSLIHI